MQKTDEGELAMKRRWHVAALALLLVMGLAGSAGAACVCGASACVESCACSPGNACGPDCGYAGTVAPQQQLPERGAVVATVGGNAASLYVVKRDVWVLSADGAKRTQLRQGMVLEGRQIVNNGGISYVWGITEDGRPVLVPLFDVGFAKEQDMESKVKESLFDSQAANAPEGGFVILNYEKPTLVIEYD